MIVMTAPCARYTSPAHGEDGSPVSQDSRLLLSVAEYPDTAPHSTPTLPPSPPAPQAPPAPDTSEAQAQPELLKYKYNLKQQQPERSEAEAGEGLPSLDLGAGVWDKLRLFRSHMFTVTPSNWAQLSTTSLVCLGAQTSVDRSPVNTSYYFKTLNLAFVKYFCYALIFLK